MTTLLGGVRRLPGALKRAIRQPQKDAPEVVREPAILQVLQIGDEVVDAQGIIVGVIAIATAIVLAVILAVVLAIATAIVLAIVRFFSVFVDYLSQADMPFEMASESIHMPGCPKNWLNIKVHTG